ncbi:MAG: hypothetical protein WBM35_01760 [Candidatus Electrothrix sp.]
MLFRLRLGIVSESARLEEVGAGEVISNIILNIFTSSSRPKKYLEEELRPINHFSPKLKK